MDTISKYSSKADVYARYRWAYHPQAIDALFELIGGLTGELTGLGGEATVADIGAGTGMLARHFVGRVGQLFAVEPNAEMRRLAERDLAANPTFHSVEGRAEATTLPDRAVDLIVVGRAIHWFDPEPTRREFRRILKPGGWLAIFRNPTDDPLLLQEIRRLRTAEYGWDVQKDKWQFEHKPFSFYFGHDQFQQRRIPHTQQERWPTFLGRLRSFSPTPDPDHPRYPQFERAARAIFDTFSQDGLLTIKVATEFFVGRMAW